MKITDEDFDEIKATIKIIEDAMNELETVDSASYTSDDKGKLHETLSSLRVKYLKYILNAP